MICIGIDLGTTNSLIAYWQEGKPVLIKNSVGQVMTPSVVGIHDDGKIIVGEIAKCRLVTHPHLTISEFKRYMGTDKVFKLGKQKFRAEELSAIVLKSLIADAEALLGEKVESAVISVPAYFSDAQRKATRDAGRLAGIEVSRLINEPTAAAIAYGLHESQNESCFLVFDIGGGTFDVSVLELFDDVMQVNATAGDNHLGGEDFVDAMVDYCLEGYSLHRSDLRAEKLAHLRNSCEQAKRLLSVEQSASVNLESNGKIINVIFSRHLFEKITHDLIKRMRMPLERAINDADLNGDDFDAVILVGGASRMPIIRSVVSKMLGKIPHSHINPDEIVALGACVQSALVAGEQSLSEVVLTDVSPYTLGIGVNNELGFHDSGELFHPIIDRNSPVPVSKVDTFYTCYDYQIDINIFIYQGEARLVKDNIKLGKIVLKVPRARKGEESVDIRFTYDVSGLLEVEAKVNSTGISDKIVIQEHAVSLSDKEIKERLLALQKLKIHPRDDAQNSLLLARGDRLYEISIGETRQYIASLMNQFESILKKQNQEEIKRAVAELNEILTKFEENSFIS